MLIETMTQPVIEPVEEFFMFKGVPCESRHYKTGCRWRVKFGDSFRFFKTREAADAFAAKMQ